MLRPDEKIAWTGFRPPPRGLQMKTSRAGVDGLPPDVVGGISGETIEALNSLGGLSMPGY